MLWMTRLLWMTLLLGCSKALDDDGSGPTAQQPATDTYPAFYGTAPENVLVISIDTFRRDRLARYGDEDGLTPFLDGLLEQSVVLDDHRSCSNWTYPGSMCAMDGRGPLDIGFMPSFTREPLPDRTTLASTLTDAGYHTVLITSNGWLYDDTNMAYGFTYADHPSSDLATTIYETARDKLLETIGDGEPWFMHIHLKEPHTPYDPPDSYLDGLTGLPALSYDLTDFDQHYDATSEWPSLSEEEQALLLQHLLIRYAGELTYLDDQLQQIWIDLMARGLLSDTLVVFWTDHGEQFFEHDGQAHALSLHQEENSGVSFFWADNIVPAAHTDATTNADIPPTILDILGLPIPDEMTGYPIGQAPAGRPIFSITDARLGPMQSVVMDDLKLIYRWDTGDKLLYDLVADPVEAEDIYDAEDAQVAALWEELLPKVEAFEAIIGESPVDPGP